MVHLDAELHTEQPLGHATQALAESRYPVLHLEQLEAEVQVSHPLEQLEHREPSMKYVVLQPVHDVPDVQPLQPVGQAEQTPALG